MFGYWRSRLRDEKLLEHALRHRSVGDFNNERLEFLGDAILSADYRRSFISASSCANEGELSRMRAILVSGAHLAELAKELALGQHLKLGRGEMKSGGQQRESILADALEALIGAIYFDSDMETCCRCVFHWYGERLDDYLSEMHPAKDAKSHFRNGCRRINFLCPLTQRPSSGKPHAQTFVVTCEVQGLPYIACRVRVPVAAKQSNWLRAIIWSF